MPQCWGVHQHFSGHGERTNERDERSPGVFPSSLLSPSSAHFGFFPPPPTWKGRVVGVGRTDAASLFPSLLLHMEAGDGDGAAAAVVGFQRRPPPLLLRRRRRHTRQILPRSGPRVPLCTATVSLTLLSRHTQSPGRRRQRLLSTSIYPRWMGPSQLHWKEGEKV